MKNTKHKFKRLDLNVAYACNIKCSGCISLSDFPRKGVVSLEEVDSWLRYWSEYVNIDVMVLFGGEPLINPNILDICKCIRNYYPNTTIRLITNGYLLDNFNPAKWFDFEPFEIQVSIHRLDHESIINKKIKNILAIRKNWTTTVDQLNSHQQIKFTSSNFTVYKSKFKDFVAPYGVKNNKLVALQSDPVVAHKLCGSPNTPVLYKGKIYKCPPVANLIDMLDENWNNYKSCDSHKDLPQFIKLIGQPESVCSQCPDNTNAIIFNHFDRGNVRVNEKNFN